MVQYSIIQYLSYQYHVYHRNAPNSAPIVEFPVQVAVGWRPSAANTSTHALGQSLLGLRHVQVQGVRLDALTNDLSADVEGGVGAMLQDGGVRCVLRARVVLVICPLLLAGLRIHHAIPGRRLSFFIWSDSRRLQRKLLLLTNEEEEELAPHLSTRGENQAAAVTYSTNDYDILI